MDSIPFLSFFMASFPGVLESAILIDIESARQRERASWQFAFKMSPVGVLFTHFWFQPRYIEHTTRTAALVGL